jgi:O-antigen/teichoic acid export membrane protein
MIVLVAGLLTGPMLARSLGADGRGHLASIVVPVTLLGWLAGLGLGSWVTVEASRGRNLSRVLGTSAALSCAFSVVAAGVAIPAAVALADHNHTVLLFLLCGVALLPFTLFVQLLSCAAIGSSQWTRLARHRALPSIVAIALTGGLFVTGELTLTTAAAAFLIGGILSVLPLLPMLRDIRPIRIDRSLTKPALGFGARAWASSAGAVTNARVDQLLMIPLVPPRQLGLYAVAVTYASLPSILSSAIATVIAPRVTAGDHALVGRGLRVTLGLMTLAGLALSLLAPAVIPLAFGSDFESSVEMAWILLLAGVPFAGTLMLTSALSSVGRPGTPALGQLVAGVVTVTGLVLLLPSMQGIGAAIVSLVAYSIALVFMIAATRRYLRTSVEDLLKPQRGDLAWAAQIMRLLRARFVRSRHAGE